MRLSFSDIHTHTPGRPSSILSVPAEKVGVVVAANLTKPDAEQQYYSIELHPWHLTADSIATFESVVNQYRDDPHFVAIGECGLDGLCATPLDLQLAAFRRALQLARSLHKPVIIHCVKLWNELIRVVREIRSEYSEYSDFSEYSEYSDHSDLPSNLSNSSNPSYPYIVHGFRKGPQLARQLLDAGFSISIGSRYNPEILPLIPPDRLYHETDEE